MSDKKEHIDILVSLGPLFERAEREGLWFFCPYQHLWFSPRQLRQAQAQGRFLWGLPNWKLRHPQERIREAEAAVEMAEAELQRVIRDIDQEKMLCQTKT